MAWDLGVTVGCTCSERCLRVAGPEAGEGAAGVLDSSPRAPSSSSEPLRRLRVVLQILLGSNSGEARGFLLVSPEYTLQRFS